MKAQIGVFSATVPQNTVAVFLVEATENIPVTEAPVVTEPDTDGDGNERESRFKCPRVALDRRRRGGAVRLRGCDRVAGCAQTRKMICYAKFGC